jgi:FkbM family methyltransferase
MSKTLSPSAPLASPRRARRRGRFDPRRRSRAMTSGRRLPALLAQPIERVWLRVLPTLTRDYLSVVVDGVRLFGSSEHQRFMHWLLKGSYERHMRRLFKHELTSGMRVLDVGANIGYYTLLAADAVGSAGRVFAFECVPSNARFLRHNVALNGFSNTVSIVQKAAGRGSGVSRCFADTRYSLRSSLVLEPEGAQAIDVECTTIDDVVGSRESIDVAKVDVEGMEIDAIKGMEQTIARSESLTMFVECCPHMLSLAGGSVAELLGELDRHDFRVQIIDEPERRLSADLSELFAAERAGDKKYSVNLYCKKRP